MTRTRRLVGPGLGWASSSGVAGTLLLLLGACANPSAPTQAKAPPQPSPAARSFAHVNETPAPAGKTYDAIAIASMREKAIGILTDAATAGAPEVRVNAIEGLSSTPRRLEPILRAALVDPVPALRITAAVVVGNIKLDSSASFVEPLLQDPVLAVRAAAAYALQRCGRNPNMSALADLLADPSPRWRAQAAYLLGLLGDKSALPMLEEAVKDDFPRASASEVRLMELQVAQARVRLGDEEAIQTIHASLFPARSEDLEATALAAQLIGEVKDESSKRELVMLTRMRDDAGNTMPPEVRLAAAGSLASLHVEQAAPDAVAREFITNQTPTIRAQAVFVLGQTGNREYLLLLEPVLSDSSPAVRVTAAAAILKLSDAAASAGVLR